MSATLAPPSAATVAVPPALDARSVGGTIAVVGDVHGSRVQLEKLLAHLDEVHPSATLVFVGDLADRGDDTPGCYRIVGDLVAAGRARMVSSNHGEALVVRAGPLLARGLDAQGVADALWRRYDEALAAGRRQPATRMTAETVTQFAFLPDGTERLAAAVALEVASPHQLLLDGGRLLVVHGGVRPDLVGCTSREAVSVAWYGTPSAHDPHTGRPLGRDSWTVAWGDARRRDPSLPLVVYGHVAYTRPFVGPHAVGIDTGAGKLRDAPVTAAICRDGRVVDLVDGRA